MPTGYYKVNGPIEDVISACWYYRVSSHYADCDMTAAFCFHHETEDFGL